MSETRENTVPFRKGIIVCYGDSNTYGYAPTYLMESRYPDDVIWTNILAGRSDRKVLNYGTCGREIPHTERQIQHVRQILRGWVREAEDMAKPDAPERSWEGEEDSSSAPGEEEISPAHAGRVSGAKQPARSGQPQGDQREEATSSGDQFAPVYLWIMLGTNDLLSHSGFRAGDVSARMESFLRGLVMEPCVRNGTVRIRLIAPPPLQSGEWTFEEKERLLAQSRCLGKEYLALAQRLTAETGVPILCTDASVWDISLVYDGVHFSEEGHRAFAAGILEEVL